VVANGEIWTVDDAKRCRQAAGGNALMLGRGMVVDPGLALAIRQVDEDENAVMDGHASANADTALVTWQALLPLIGVFWHLVCSRLERRQQAGRLKQWLNFLRRRYPQAEAAYQELRVTHDPAVVSQWLARQLPQA
jgi:tRNA-dihydrouridine synthase C